jgi:hypothetical protein
MWYLEGRRSSQATALGGGRGPNQLSLFEFRDPRARGKGAKQPPFKHRTRRGGNLVHASAVRMPAAVLLPFGEEKPYVRRRGADCKKKPQKPGKDF